MPFFLFFTFLSWKDNILTYHAIGYTLWEEISLLKTLFGTTKDPRLDTGCIAQISCLIYSVINRIQKMGRCMCQLEVIKHRDNERRQFLKLCNTASK